MLHTHAWWLAWLGSAAEEGRKLGADGGLELFVNGTSSLHTKENGAKAAATAGVPSGNGKVAK